MRNDERWLQRIAELLKTAREKHKDLSTQDKLAHASRVPRSTINGIENGATNYTFATLLKLMDALDLTFADIKELQTIRKHWVRSPYREWHDKLQAILDTGEDEAITGITANIKSFYKSWVQGRRKADLPGSPRRRWDDSRNAAGSGSGPEPKK